MQLKEALATLKSTPLSFACVPQKKEVVFVFARNEIPPGAIQKLPKTGPIDRGTCSMADGALQFVLEGAPPTKPQMRVKKLQDLEVRFAATLKRETGKLWSVVARYPEEEGSDESHSIGAQIRGQDLDLRTYRLGRYLSTASGFGDVIELNPPGDGPRLVGKTQHSGRTTRDLLREEAEIYRRLGNHPRFPTCLGVQEIYGPRVLVLERVEGRTLGGGLEPILDRVRSGELPKEDGERLFRHIASQLVEGLVQVAGAGLVHGDIKSANVMVDGKTGEVRVLDVAGAIEQGGTLTMCSPEYSNAEQGSITSAFDVYCVGETLRRLFVGVELPTDTRKLLEEMCSLELAKRPTLDDLSVSPLLQLDQESREKAKALLVEEAAPIHVFEGLTLEAFRSTLQSARKVGRVGEPKRVEEIEEVLSDLEKTAWRAVSREKNWTEKKKRLDLALEVGARLNQAVKGWSKNVPGGLRSYGHSLVKAWKAEERRISAVLEVGGPVQTVDGFADRWREIKAEADRCLPEVAKALRAALQLPEDARDVDPRTFRKVVEDRLQDAVRSVRSETDQKTEGLHAIHPARRGVVDATAEDWHGRIARSRVLVAKDTSDLLGFDKNLSGALDRFESAPPSRKKEAAKEALEILKGYFTSARTLRRLELEEIAEEAGDRLEGLLDDLMVRANDLAASIVRLAR